MTQSELSADAARNRDVWTNENAAYTGKQAREAWAQDEIRWGVFQKPEAEVGALPDVAGMDVVELGCGTAYFSAWLAKRGAHPVGVDVTPAQLETARECQQEFGLEFPLIEASAEDVPLPDESFDLALSEFGASIWCEPERWVAEAARLLRPRGELVFLCNSTISILCSPDEGPVEERLVRPQFGMYRFDWPGEDEGVNFYLPHGEWVHVLRENGLDVLALHELQAPRDAVDHPHYDFVAAEWARKWPAEDIWRARKRA
ncbi:MAG: class I SAM-dependent methyltransferase [Actinomycetota bacterium]|nr:class I SAM-dependent methyltransferase [Actinomycetota bacterium]